MAEPQKSKERINELWETYMVDRSVEIKNELLEHYLHLVRGIVLRMMPTYQGHNEYDDLLSSGVMGLMDAIDRFDISRDVKFETYASLRIRGEIMDYMRKQDWAPSSLRRKISQISDAYSDLEVKLGRSARDEDVAKHLSMDVSDIRKTMEKSHTFNLMYFEDMLTEGRSLDHDALNDPSETPGENLEREELVTALTRCIDSLQQNERLVVTLYYYEELMLKEIAAVLNVSESRVSQIHSRAMMKLRAKMQKEL